MSSEKLSTRDRILNATRTLLEAGDGATTRMSDVAKKAQISRQALYLHFPNRADLLIATVRHVDDVKNVDARFAESRTSLDGPKKLAAWIDAWGNYIPEIHGVARALIAMRDTDAAAKAAWDDRMKAVYHGCEAVVAKLVADGILQPKLSSKEAADLLATLVSIQSWEMLRLGSGWSQSRYISVLKETAAKTLLKNE